MNPTPPMRSRGAGLLHRFHTRFLIFAAVAIIVVGLSAGLALARGKAASIGTGVVVIETKLAYENGAAAGTGMVLTSSGEILTNNHVIDGATNIKVVVPGTGHSYTARVVGYDVSADVAVLQASNASNLKTVSIGNSSTLKVGEAVTATGNAEGTGSLTTTSGEITGLARAITVSDDQGGTESLRGLIETNSQLEPGDSGGPLLNAAGRVVGMDTAASTGSGYGYRQLASTDSYAIPINTAVALATQIEAGKASSAVHIGATAFLGVDVSSNGDGSSGALIGSAVANGAASKAGLVAGDVITSIDGRTVSSPTSLGAILQTEKAGARISITYLDTSGATNTTTVTLASGPPQ
ncbi:MAG TPA: trypsin-like peptidase domain-containing protein [Gaiellaceae bacterium]|jgi:S1-C subfamily serine protease|nr:trypsin-like peptidase domain-containing protein [Gaiellaceae bacterium]